ncbi:MAG: type I-E CRISPR-associated protein Cse1/CasA [Candidatus Scalindua sp.]
MNLIGDPWIPVIFEDGTDGLVGLRVLYQESCHISDLSVDPPQRISLMRLLLCITQAALDGPNDDSEWLKCLDRIIPESLHYLQERKDKFYLNGDKPFLQIKELTSDKKVPFDKLNICLASGHNATFFDHEANPSGRFHSLARKALNLLTFMNFSTGGKIGQAKWGENRFSHETFAAPCIKSAHTIIRGKNLFKTIFFNLLSKKVIANFPNMEWGKPVWDNFPGSLDDKESFDNASRTYLGRLVPLSRFILLGNDSEKKFIVGPTYKSYVISHLPEFREPSTTVISTKKGKIIYLPLSSEKHIWRELGSVLSLSKSMEAGGAVCLQNIQKFIDHFKGHVEIWIGGLESNQAKLIDLVEWNISIPINMLGGNTLSLYKNGVNLAKNGEQAVREAVNLYCNEMSVKKESKKGIINKAVLNYWSFLDNHYKLLIDLANMEDELDKWIRLLYRAINGAYYETCPHETPRQIQAFSKSKGRLMLKTHIEKSK